VSLFQRIKSPFTDFEDDAPPPPRQRPHPVGELLRERREELGLDLDEIGETLRIRPVYLVALEQGRAQDLPGPTYALGFIRAYAHHLGFDSDRILERYKAESAEVQVRPDLALPVPLGARSLPGGPILLVGLILALCGYGTWYYLSTGERSRPERVAAVPAELRQPPRQGAAASSPGDAYPVPGTSTAAAGQRFGSGLVSPPDAAAAPGTPATTSPSPGLVASPAAAALPAPAPPPPAAQGHRPPQPKRRLRKMPPPAPGLGASTSAPLPIAGSRCARPIRRSSSHACLRPAKPTMCRAPACSCAPAMPGR